MAEDETRKVRLDTPDIDLIDPARYEQRGLPFAEFRWLRDYDPVHWHADPNENVPGFWAVTRHADITHVSRHAELFSSYARGALFEEWSEEDLNEQRLMMLNMDPPQHTRQRSFVNRGFTPGMMRKLREHIKGICLALLDDIDGHEEVDFVEHIAAPLPIHVICEMVGASGADRQMIFELSNRLVGFDDPELQSAPEDGQKAAAAIYEWASEIAADRRKQPREDIISRLLRPDEQGEILTDMEICLFVLLLVIAGNETVRNGASGGMIAFFNHPDQWQRLMDDPSLFKTAPDELVRWATPVGLMRRMATQDTVLGETKISAGDKVVIFYGSGNRDDRVFEHPDRFDIGRDPNPHVGFGSGGPHFCLGTHLARLELAVLFEAIGERIPHISLAGEPRRLRSNFINGYKEIPVRVAPLPGRLR